MNQLKIKNPISKNMITINVHCQLMFIDEHWKIYEHSLMFITEHV